MLPFDLSPVGALLALAAVAYLLGAIPFGYVVGRLKGVDLRAVGSRNIGATNAGRVFGRRYFWLVFALDVVKGLLPTLAASWVAWRVAPEARTALFHAAWVLVAAAAVVGHLFPVYLGFRGGKGVAVGLGMLLGTFPYFTLPGMVAGLVYLAVLKRWRYVSLASIAATASLPVTFAVAGALLGWDVFGALWPMGATLVTISAAVIAKHRANIARLRAGTESKIGARAAVTPKGDDALRRAA